MVNGKHKTCLLSGLNDPRGMARSQTLPRIVVITDQQGAGCKLHFVEILPHLEIDPIVTNSVPVKNPRKVFSDVSELLIGQMGTSQFVICNTEGDVRKVVNVADQHFPRCVASTPDGYIALMWDKDTKCSIVWMDHTGKYCKTYSHSDSKLLKKAHHMAVDKDGRVIVADYTDDRLHLVDDKHSKCLLTKDDGILGPMCVHIDEASSLLYVAHGQIGAMEVRAYKWYDLDKTFQLELAL